MIHLNREADSSHAFKLPIIAANLEGLEETIIYTLLDRAQYAVNKTVYAPGQSGFPNADKQSLLDVRLGYQEDMDARFGRFAVPEERPFSSHLPGPARTISIEYLGLPALDFGAVNVTRDILFSYIKLVESICVEGDDKQHGSSVEQDVYALQAISRRVHYGAVYVAESKYRSRRDEFDVLLEQNDDEAVINALTRPEIEAQILKRVVVKTKLIQENINTKVRRTVDSRILRDFYRSTIIPLTKKGELLYLKTRKRS